MSQQPAPRSAELGVTRGGDCGEMKCVSCGKVLMACVRKGYRGVRFTCSEECEGIRCAAVTKRTRNIRNACTKVWYARKRDASK